MVLFSIFKSRLNFCFQGSNWDPALFCNSSLSSLHHYALSGIQGLIVLTFKSQLLL